MATTQPTSDASLTRLTVNLIPTANEALDRAAARERLSKTDIINRAIQMYDYLREHEAGGQDILTRDKATGDLFVLRVL